MLSHPNEVPVADLRRLCDPLIFDFETTAEILPLDQVIGQERAVRAITFGLEMKSDGYHIIVTGPEGTGKTTITHEIAATLAKTRPTPPDWCMVNNFRDAYRPKVISVSPGQAIRFSKSINRLVSDLKIRMPKEFQSPAFHQKMAEIQERHNKTKQTHMDHLDEVAAENNLKVEKTDAGYQVIPMDGDHPHSQASFDKLPGKVQRSIERAVEKIQDAIEAMLREVGRISAVEQKEIRKQVDDLSLGVIKNRIDLVRENYAAEPEILKFLDEMQADMVEHVSLFMPRQVELEPEEAQVLPDPEETLSLNRYRINVLEDRSDLEGAPVVFEPNPTHAALFGHIDKKPLMGTLVTDFTMVQSGALLRANGGFLILEVDAILNPAQVWETLSRSLQNHTLQIEDVASDMGLGTVSLRPSPIPLNLKVILLGDYDAFQALQVYDPKFNKIFRIRADFDVEVTRTRETIYLYARFIARVCRDAGLLPFTPRGVSAVVEYGKKTIESKDKLSLRFGAITGVLKEADYWARKENADRVTETHVIKAFTEYRFRYNLYEEKIHENYVDGTIMIDVSGDVVGQVNALAVYQIDDLSFGRPTRITAETFMGRPGIINIERESRLSGRIHDKGVMILSGYLGRTFAQHYPLSLSISLTFEQSYSGIDGDSASSTELYAILSSLSDIPIHQGIAVTGSINQKGQIQSIGGINQKIEGFFDVCQSKGLTGIQGVMIPAANVKNLMLKKSVIDAVKKNQFRIWQVSTVTEGIEILTGVPAGKPNKNGKYPARTVYGQVQKKLEQYLKQSLRLKSRFGDEHKAAEK
ncbi:AAA family ATPase [Desulfosarcina sp. OttesenSCG-928-A07]|nr:AAA family ATPase [Desulfosarcina sp. OttesenSCG-928-G17]MDL2328588.1 AAA family ATPase [Desulfosarcina sp. OttesenSCG-928-A07]